MSEDNLPSPDMDRFESYDDGNTLVIFDTHNPDSGWISSEKWSDPTQ